MNSHHPDKAPMTAGTYTTEVIRRVYDGNHALSVGPSGDFDNNVMVYAEPFHEDYFGALRIDMPKEFMKQLALAILASVGDAP